MNKKPGPGSKMVPAIFIGKSKVKIMSSLVEKSPRHGQLRRRLGNVSQRMLTRTLRILESTGLIARRGPFLRNLFAGVFLLGTVVFAAIGRSLPPQKATSAPPFPRELVIHLEKLR